MDLIKNVTPLPDYWLSVEMGSGNIVRLDMKPRLKAVRFKVLSNQEIFNSVRTNGCFLVWGNKVQLGASEIMDMVMNPKKIEK